NCRAPPIPLCKYDERTVESEGAPAATSAFDDLGRPRYDKLWRISVLRVVVSFLFRIAICCLNAHGIWYLVAGQQKLQRHWQLPPLVLAVVLPIKSSGLICTRSSCVRNARNGVSAMRPLPNRSRKPVLFVKEPLKRLGNGRANEREPRRNRSQQRKIDLPSPLRHGRQSVIRRMPNPTRETRGLPRSENLIATRKNFPFFFSVCQSSSSNVRLWRLRCRLHRKGLSSIENFENLTRTQNSDVANFF